MSERLLSGPEPEMIVAGLSGIGAGSIPAMFYRSLVDDGVLEPTVVATAVVLLISTGMAALVLYRVEGSITWEEEADA